MAFQPIFMSGFEMGSIFQIGGENISGDTSTYILRSSTNTKTGSYCLRQIASIIGTSATQYNIPVGSVSGEIYVSMWIRPVYTVTLQPEISAVLSDGSLVSVSYDNNNRVNARVNGTIVAYGNLTRPTGSYFHLQVHFLIANSGGKIETKIDGTPDITYTGDTQPGSTTTINYIRSYVPGGTSRDVYIDDITVGTGDWPGDIRYDKLVPTGDVTAEWSRSTGSYNYAVVDEIPPSNTDYIYTQVSGATDLYTMEDWDATGKVPVAVIHWLLAKKETSDDSHVIPIITVSGVTWSGELQDLSTEYHYYGQIAELTPLSGIWSDDYIDNMQVGVVGIR